MKKLQYFNVLLVTAIALAAPQASQAASLLEIYQQALQSDPQIHEAEARRLAALEAKPQARGVLFPQISFDGSWEKSESDGSSTQFDVQLCDPNGDPTDPDEPRCFEPFSVPSESRS